jgi:hypothetical protein
MQPTKRPPKGLQFIQTITAHICDGYDCTYEWSDLGDAFKLTLYCTCDPIEFFLDRALLDDPGSDAYRDLADRLFQRMSDTLKQCPAAPTSRSTGIPPPPEARRH